MNYRILKKLLLLILFNFITNSTTAQNIKIDTIFFAYVGGKRTFTNYYHLTEKSIVRNRRYSNSKNQNEKKIKENTLENWNKLLSKIDIAYFSKIKNGKSRSAHCGSDFYISLKLKNGKKINVVNASNDKMWREIKDELNRLRSEIED